jgi:hypothetical protein
MKQQPLRLAFLIFSLARKLKTANAAAVAPKRQGMRHFPLPLAGLAASNANVILLHYQTIGPGYGPF